MPVLQPHTSLPPPSSPTLVWNLKPRSSPEEAQPAGLIALGVCLGVALAIVLIWYTCCRAQTGPLKEVQMCKRGSRMRKEVYDTSDSYPSPMMMPPLAYGASNGYPNPVTVPPQAYGISHSYGDPAAPPQTYGISNSYGDPAAPTQTYGDTDPYPNPVMAPPPAAMGSGMTHPPKAYTHHAMSYLDPRKSVEPQAVPASIQAAPEMTEAPLGRRAVTSLPLPMFTRSLGGTNTRRSVRKSVSRGQPSWAGIRNCKGAWRW
ncbi:uncharacterized protein B0H64DRAFT_314076 [Chaetomium fimeti]|uniref:Uncharacterized protein n=1 Tax=Chaetomium fimeti TaxID=1854472 RepID=A0AAE0HNI1_9PEZI|nr:hypothetical protein B0H64DRAFT_314076 [Chaetomium fimeti]